LKYKARVAVVGAGMSGSLMAIYLARQGYTVDVYERRPDRREYVTERGMSLNMTLSQHGIAALAAVDILQTVMRLTTRLEGRMIHDLDGRQHFQPYGKNEREVIYSIRRHDLNCALLDAAQAQPGVTLHFQQRCLRYEKQDTREGQGTKLLLQNTATHRTDSVSADWIIGADGVFSAIRQQMQRDLLIETQQESLEWGYKEIAIPAGPGGKHVFANNVFHMWPRGDYMLMAVPNQDGSFTGTCVLPFQGKLSFATLRCEEQIRSFFNRHFADALPWMPSLVEDFQHNPTGEFITLYASPWHDHDRVVLIGDACHSFVPFYGQGMNASLADCQILSACLEQGGEDHEQAFKAYQQLRKRHTDAMAQLSKENFTEIREKVRSPFFVLYKRLDLLLNKLFPGIWVPLYSLIMYTNMPYADAIARAKKQERLLKWLMLTLLLSGVGGVLRIVFMHFSGGRRRSQ